MSLSAHPSKSLFPPPSASARPVFPRPHVSQPRRLHADDPRIAWISQRPYLVHNLLGSGAFGDVYRVELLAPCGTRVLLDPSGNPRRTEGSKERVLVVSGRRHEEEDNPRTVRRGRAQRKRSAEILSRGRAGRVTPRRGSSGESSFSSRSRSDSDSSRFAASESLQEQDLQLPRTGRNLAFVLVRESVAPPPVRWFRIGRGTEESVVPARAATSSANIKGETMPGNRNTSASSSAKNVQVLSSYENAGPNFRLQSTGLFFALKLMGARNAKQYKLFVEEVEHMRGFVGVEHVLQIQDYECDTGSMRVVILMELAVSDLQTFLQEHNWELDAQLITSIFRAMVDAIAVVHERDVIHFDLKPQNFLLVPKRTIACSAGAEQTASDLVFFGGAPADGGCRDEANQLLPMVGVVTMVGLLPMVESVSTQASSTTTTENQPFCLKIGDFGLAHRLLDDATHLSSDLAPGTTAFMAPEALYQPGSKGRKKLTPKVDVWSLGVMLYKMLHRGQTPWEGHRQLGRMELAMAIADPRSRPIFEKTAAWDLQRRLLDENCRGSSGKSTNGSEAKNCRASSGAIVQFSLRTTFREMEKAVAAHGEQESVPANAKEDHLQTRPDGEEQHAIASALPHVAFEGYCQLKLEFLFRVCQKCLEFDVDRRVTADELRDLCRQEGQFSAREFLDAFAEHLSSFQGEELFPEKISCLRRMARDVPPFCALWPEDGQIVVVSGDAKGLDSNGIFSACGAQGGHHDQRCLYTFCDAR